MVRGFERLILTCVSIKNSLEDTFYPVSGLNNYRDDEAL